ncbi:MAG: amidohydrolase family protein [Nitrospirae bacterium]|nr:amidohydrolase family protein [Nitrospirota bacterium]
MQNVDYIIGGDYVLTMDENLTVIENGAVAIKGNKIIDVGVYSEIYKKYNPEKEIRREGSVILPGLINTHTHAAMVYFRGIADDLPLKIWLENHIWPAENKWLSPEFIYDAVELACLEMLKGGVTTYNDMYFFEDAAGETTKKVGMRAVLGTGILDFPTVSARTPDEYLENARSFVNNWKGDELITPCIAPHAIYSCSTETLEKSRAIAEKFNVPLHIHLSETQWEAGEVKIKHNKKPVEYLESLGFLDEKVLAAHCIWIDDDEIEILARRKVGVSHCMESNLKLASGFAPVVTMLMAGVKVTFGTDGAASNNDLNILSEMSTTAKVHKALSNNPTVLDAKKALLMGTRWGADVLGLGDKIGSLEKGKLADIVMLDLNKPHLTPVYDVYSHIVYAAMASDIETVMVNGKLVIDNRKLLTGDEAEILYKAVRWAEKIKRHLLKINL